MLEGQRCTVLFVVDTRRKRAQAKAGLKKKNSHEHEQLIRYLWYNLLSCSRHWNFCVYFHMWMIECLFFLLLLCVPCRLQRKLQVTSFFLLNLKQTIFSFTSRVMWLESWLIFLMLKREKKKGSDLTTNTLLVIWILLCVPRLFASINKLCIYFLTVLCSVLIVSLHPSILMIERWILYWYYLLYIIINLYSWVWTHHDIH